VTVSRLNGLGNERRDRHRSYATRYRRIRGAPIYRGGKLDIADPSWVVASIHHKVRRQGWCIFRSHRGHRRKRTIKQHLAGLRMLFDWLVVGHVLLVNPAAAVRGPRYSVKKGKTPIFGAEEARTLLDSIPASSAVGLRDRALIALMVYTFARINAALRMRVGDVYVQNRRTWVRLHEKGGKRHEMPCHHNLDDYLAAYIRAADIVDDDAGYLFRTARGAKQASCPIGP
jgi:site-specific recombinase XerC